MNIGKKIKILRAKKGMSQQILADSINKTRTLISHIEVTSKVNHYTLLEISKALDVNISYFTDDNYYNNVVQEPIEDYSHLSDQLQKLKRENELLNEIIVNQKDLISELRKQLKN